MGAHPYARVSFPSPDGRGLLCRSLDISHVFFPMPSHRGKPRSLRWLDLAEGWLRLDRLCRNGDRETFFPWACHPAQTRGDPGSPIPREARKSP
jgi:hypothetical protein